MTLAFEEDVKLRSLEAAADLSAKQFYGVYIDTSGKAALCAAAGVHVYGVLQNTPTSGKQASVAVSGVVRAIAGGTIAPGAKVKVDSAGKFVTAAAATADASGSSATAAITGSYVVGIARNTANTASGDIFPLELLQLGVIPGTAA